MEDEPRWKKSQRLARRNAHLKRNYGITTIEYDAMILAQEGKCKICKRIPLEFKRSNGSIHPGFVVDHCHNSSKIRGLLCDRCNRALGLVEDNIELLEAMKLYLS